jgi:hypothetical protein
MKSYFSFNFIKIDLRLINTVQNAKRILEENSISDCVSAEKIFEWKPTVDILFLDPIKFTIVAFIYKKEKQINFVSELYQELQAQEPIKFIKKEKVFSTSLKIDSILEKISSRGINSLTKEEKDFLDNQSKK